MLASGADVKIGDLEVNLFKDPELPFRYYTHLIEPQYARNTEGTPGVETIRQEIKFWIRDDWSGGEGDKFHSPEFNNLYYEGTNANPRVPGTLRARPSITLSGTLAQR